MRYATILTSEEITKTMMDKYIEDKKGYWKDGFSFDEAVIETTNRAAVEIFFCEDVLDEFEENELNIFRKKYSKEPRTYINVTISSKKGSDEFAARIIEELIDKWSGMVDITGCPGIKDLLNVDLF